MSNLQSEIYPVLVSTRQSRNGLSDRFIPAFTSGQRQSHVQKAVSQLQIEFAKFPDIFIFETAALSARCVIDSYTKAA